MTPTPYTVEIKPHEFAYRVKQTAMTGEVVSIGVECCIEVGQTVAYRQKKEAFLANGNVLIPINEVYAII
jgi:hypothetical protein